jgi:hypothetical protein
MELPLVIDCGTCVVRSTGACDDCVVTFLLDGPANGGVTVDAGEARILRLLHDGGLIPGVRHEPDAAAS